MNHNLPNSSPARPVLVRQGIRLALAIALGLWAAHSAKRAGAEAFTWNSTNAGNWSDNSVNGWNAVGVPNSPGDVASLLGGPAANRIITLNLAPTVGKLNLGTTSAAYWQIGANAANPLQLDNAGAGAEINFTQGGTAGTTAAANSVVAPLLLNDNLTASAASGAFGVLTGGISESGGARSLTKTSAGYVGLAGTMNFTGGVFIHDGILGPAAATGVVALPSGSNVTLGNGTSSGILRLGAGNNPGSVTLGNISTSGTGTANAIYSTSGGGVLPLTLNITGTSTYAGILGGTVGNEKNFSITKTGTGTLILSNPTPNANFFTGGMTINQGTLRNGADEQITRGEFGAVTSAAGLTVGAAGTWDLNGFTETINALQGAVGGVVNLNGGALRTSNNSNIAGVFNGAIHGGATGVVEKFAGGAPQTYAGLLDADLKVTAGRLRASGVVGDNRTITISSGGFLDLIGGDPLAGNSITTTIASGGALRLDSGAATTNTFNLGSGSTLSIAGAGSGSAGFNGGAIINVSGDNTLNASPSLSANASIMVFGGSLTLPSTSVISKGNFALTFNGISSATPTLTLNGAITGTGSTSLNGSSTLLATVGSTAEIGTPGVRGAFNVGAQAANQRAIVTVDGGAQIYATSMNLGVNSNAAYGQLSNSGTIDLTGLLTVVAQGANLAPSTFTQTAGSLTTNGILLSGGGVTNSSVFNFNGGTLNFTGATGLTITNGGGSAGGFIQAAGTAFTVPTVSVGHAGGGTALGRVETAGTMNITDTLLVGASQGGTTGSTFLQESGSAVTAGGLITIQSASPNSTATYNLAGGTLQANGGIKLIGATMRANFTQAAGTTLDATNLLVGNQTGDITGYGGTVTTAGTMNLTGNLSIYAGRSNSSGTQNDSVFTQLPDSYVTVAGVLSLSSGNAKSATFNLDGGTLEVGGTIASEATAANRFKFNGGTLKARDASLAFHNSIVTTIEAGGGTIDTNGLDVTLSNNLLVGAVAGGGLEKTGLGKLTLSGANTYTGLTHVSAGTLAIEGSITSDVTVAGTGILSGSGTIAGDILLTNGGALAPGNHSGTITQTTGDMTWLGGASYVWEINSADTTFGSGQGTDSGYDWTHIVSGSLDLGSLNSSNQFTIEITSLDLTNNPGEANNFLSSNDYYWTLLSASNPITDFSPDKFLIDYSNFANPMNGGAFSLMLGDGAGHGTANDLVLKFSAFQSGAVPEPGTLLLLAAGLATWVCVARRKSRT